MGASREGPTPQAARHPPAGGLSVCRLTLSRAGLQRVEMGWQRHNQVREVNGEMLALRRRQMTIWDLQYEARVRVIIDGGTKDEADDQFATVPALLLFAASGSRP